MNLPGNTRIKTAARPPITDMTTPILGISNARSKLNINQITVSIIRLGLALLSASSDDKPHAVTHILSTASLEAERVKIKEIYQTDCTTESDKENSDFLHYQI